MCSGFPELPSELQEKMKVEGINVGNKLFRVHT
jgi:hypothetical protein